MYLIETLKKGIFMSKTFLVIGSTGTVGSEVVKNLKAQGHLVKEATSKVVRNSNQVHINLITGEGRETAFKNVDGLFMLSPAGYTHQAAILIPLIQEAVENKLKKVVLMTAMGANANEEGPLRKAEVALEKSGLSYNIIRPNWFMQNFNSYWIQDIKTHGQIRLAAGDAKVSFIDARDIGRVAATLLTTDQFANRDFELTGPDALDHSSVAMAISEVTGKEITYVDITSEQFKSNLLKSGLPADYTEVLVMIMGYLKLGYSAPTFDNVEKITGQKPISLQKYVQDYAAFLK